MLVPLLDRWKRIQAGVSVSRMTPKIASRSWAAHDLEHGEFANCKEYISNYRKWLRKLYVYSTNINTSDEDKHDTNYNNNNDANTDTRKLHNE